MHIDAPTTSQAHLEFISSWWFQPIWKIFVKSWVISPIFGMKMQIFVTTAWLFNKDPSFGLLWSPDITG